MERLSKDALLGASDLVEREVELPALGGSVLVRSLPAAYSNQASSEALVYKSDGNHQYVTVDSAKLEILQVLHGLVDPQLGTIQEAERFAQQCGPSFKEVIRVIDEISGVDKEELERTQRQFPVGGDGGGGLAAGDDRPKVHLSAGAADGEEPA